MTRFRIATYNVHKCRGLDWKIRPDRILHVIRELDSDVIALHEILADQVKYFAASLDMHHIFGAARKLGGQEYGNVVFTRFPIRSTNAYDLTIKHREPRSCIRVDFELPDQQQIHLFAAHLGTSYFERRHQARRLVSDEILADPGLKGPRILVGDFNEWSRGLVTQTLSRHLQSGELSAHLRRSRTYPGVLPFLHLDHIYYDPALRLIGMRVYRTATSLIASDHLPLAGEFEL